MRSIYLLPLSLLLACGDDKGRPARPDAPDQMIDAAIDAPAPIPCAYNEMADATNDDLFGNGNAETTAINFTAPTAICGKFNMGHYNNQRMNVDVDMYQITVPAMTSGILYVTAPGAENFDSVLVEIYGLGTGNFTDEIGQFQGNFATLTYTLPPDDYVITVSSYDPSDTTAAIDYKITLQIDTTPRCPKSTATATPEAAEGTVGGGNDVYEVRYQGQPARALTADALDAPEAAITVEPAMSYHATGTSSTFTATPVSWMDSFQDRDTYAVTMGATTNQLSVRLNWPGTTADFDFFVFPATGVIERANGWYAGNMEDEFTTLAVTPGATYWIMVGMDDASTGAPVSYDLTLCGETFTP